MTNTALMPQVAVLTAKADLIVRGRVISSKARWNSEHTQIISEQQVAVHYTLAGKSPAVLRLATPGGYLPEEGIGLFVSDTPTLQVGEEALLFLHAQTSEFAAVDSVVGKLSVVNGQIQSDGNMAQLTIQEAVAQVESALHGARLQSSLPANWQEIEAQSLVAAAAVTAPDNYVYSGYKWNVNEVGFVVNPQSASIGAGNGTADDFRRAIVAAATTWGMDPNADFNLVYAGPTTAANTSRNHANEVLFVSRPDRLAAGIAELWFNSRNEILEADIFINDVYAWDTTGAPASSELDLQSTVVHEFGHWLALGHDDTPEAVMAATVTSGALRRVLHINDSAGIEFIYPCAQPPCLPPDEQQIDPVTPTETPTPEVGATPTPTATPSPTPDGGNDPNPNLVVPSSSKHLELSVNGRAVVLDFPVGSVSVPVHVAVSPGLPRGQQNGVVPILPSFVVTTSVGSVVSSTFAFDQPVQIRASYSPQDVSSVKESTLALMVFDDATQSWSAAICGAQTVDAIEDYVSTAICSVGEFQLVAAENERAAQFAIFLPMVTN